MGERLNRKAILLYNEWVYYAWKFNRFQSQFIIYITSPESKANRGVNKLYGGEPYNPVGERLNRKVISLYNEWVYYAWKFNHFQSQFIIYITSPESKANRGVNTLYGGEPYTPVGEGLNHKVILSILLNKFIILRNLKVLTILRTSLYIILTPPESEVSRGKLINYIVVSHIAL